MWPPQKKVARDPWGRARRLFRTPRERCNGVLFAWFPPGFRDFYEHTPYLTTVTCSENQPKAGIIIFHNFKILCVQL